jgi:hypothetical protein
VEAACRHFLAGTPLAHEKDGAFDGGDAPEALLKVEKGLGLADGLGMPGKGGISGVVKRWLLGRHTFPLAYFANPWFLMPLPESICQSFSSRGCTVFCRAALQQGDLWDYAALGMFPAHSGGEVEVH